MYAPVVCTDIDRGEILDLITSNIKRNKNYVKNNVDVMELDFTKPFSVKLIKELSDVEIILAADGKFIKDVIIVNTFLYVFSYL